MEAAKIEHRLFSAISQNWRGKPLVSHEVVVNRGDHDPDGAAGSEPMDTNRYPAGRTVWEGRMEIALCANSNRPAMAIR